MPGARQLPVVQHSTAKHGTAVILDLLELLLGFRV